MLIGMFVVVPMRRQNGRKNHSKHHYRCAKQPLARCQGELQFSYSVLLAETVGLDGLHGGGQTLNVTCYFFQLFV